MTQYVRIIKSSDAGIFRQTGTILKVRYFDEDGFYTEISEREKGYMGYYFSEYYELIPEEISNSSLFKLILDEQDLEWYNELKKGRKNETNKKR